MKNIRYMIRRDMDAVVEIDQASFKDWWSEYDFICLIRQSSIIPQVIESPRCAIAGYLLYKLRPRDREIDILRIAVHPDHRGQGYGRSLLLKVAQKLRSKYQQLNLDVDDDQLAAHLWLRACGWRAAPLWHGADVYRFSVVAEKEYAGA